MKMIGITAHAIPRNPRAKKSGDRGGAAAIAVPYIFVRPQIKVLPNPRILGFWNSGILGSSRGSSRGLLQGAARRPPRGRNAEAFIFVGDFPWRGRGELCFLNFRRRLPLAGPRRIALRLPPVTCQGPSPSSFPRKMCHKDAPHSFA